ANDSALLAPCTLDLRDQHLRRQGEVVRVPVRQLADPVTFVEAHRRLYDGGGGPVRRSEPALRFDGHVITPSALRNGEQQLGEVVARGPDDLRDSRLGDRREAISGASTLGTRRAQYRDDDPLLRTRVEVPQVHSVRL